MLNIKNYFYFDQLSLIMIGLVSFVGLVVASFSFRFLEGDRKKPHFYMCLVALLPSIFTMACSDHLCVFWLSWSLSNFILTRLMQHKKDWKAAKRSAFLAFKNFALGSIFLGLAFLILYLSTHETSIQSILHKSFEGKWAAYFLFFLTLATMTQSAIWPFQTWLMSSLNSPTPVSALMHAGLINGGGLVLARFSPMLFKHGLFLSFLFIIGFITCFLGTLWKLMQTDVKRMLASSTLSQMGFMFVQCGLGLFPAALTHLCWHGMHKAYLFLSIGSAAKEKRFDLESSPTILNFIQGTLCGFFGAYAFTITSGKSLYSIDTNLFLIFLTWVAGIQFSLPILRSQFFFKFILALFATFMMGGVYGCAINVIEHLVAPLNLASPQPLNLLHVAGIVLLTLAWLTLTFRDYYRKKQHPKWMLKFYVTMLNASQPHPETVTAHRNQYQF